MFEELKLTAKNSYDNKDYGKALELYEELRKLDADKFEKKCIFPYMWCLFRVKISAEDAFNDANINDTKAIVKYILDRQTNKDLLYQITVLKVLKDFDKRQNFDAKKVNQWLDKLDPSLLSHNTQNWECEGKEIEYISNKEKWYSLKTKACEKLEMYSECIRIAQEALDSINDLHNGNNIWFKRRIANSMSKLGQQNEAIDMLIDILKVKKDWFLNQDVGDIYFAQSNYKAALDNYVNAILAPGDDSMKIKLFWQAGNTLHYLGDDEGELLIKSYSIKIRTEHEWKLNAEEKDFASRNSEFIESNEARALRRKIIELAKSYKWKGSTPLEGSISNIMQDGKAGFIRSGTNKYYFRMNQLNSRGTTPQIGTKVSFYLEKGYDKKRCVETDNAVNINVI